MPTAKKRATWIVSPDRSVVALPVKASHVRAAKGKIPRDEKLHFVVPQDKIADNPIGLFSSGALFEILSTQF
ncbi:MAG: hypothetical protein KA250_12640 [Verrucomicrobiales bacterium]|nr:hypothetical protein [Verrucomicrobiales bacterium]